MSTASAVLYQSAKKKTKKKLADTDLKELTTFLANLFRLFAPTFTLKNVHNIQEIRLRIVIFVVTVLLEILHIYTLHESLIFKIIKVL